MFSSQQMRLVALAAGIAGMSALQLAAQNVVYKASGTFASPPISGNDLFQLRNEPFSISITAAENSVPVKSSATFAQYAKLSFTGTVTSGLTGTPITLGPQNNTSMILATGNPTVDLIDIGTGFKILNLPIGIKGQIAMSKGTLTGVQILPFTKGVTLCGAVSATCPKINATLTYTDPSTSQSTTLGMNGTLITTVTAAATKPAATASLMLHAAGAETVTTLADGTRSVRPVSGGVDLQGSGKVTLRLFASGVRDASEVQVRIGGEPVAVLYAGAASHYDGLDEVMVELPPTLAGRGDVEVELTVDGQTAAPVHLHLQ